MTTSVEIECKKIYALRFLQVLFIACVIQFLLLAVFLLFVNFSLFHPLNWLISTLGLFFSPFTWLYIIPLLIVLILYVVIISNQYLALNKYHPTRFSWLFTFGPNKFCLLYLNILLGFFTSWLYSRYLSDEYSTLIFKCFDGYCLNSRFMFISCGGISSGLYYFFTEKLTCETEIKFPVIQEWKYVQIRSALYQTIYTCFLKSFVPAVCYTVFYWLLGSYVNSYVGSILGAVDDQILSNTSAFKTNTKLMIYVWIFTSQILSNLYILDILFSVLFTETKKFTIEKDPMTQTVDITLAEALSANRVPIVQQLAALDIYNLTNSQDIIRRLTLFSLSIPGGHPYNWERLSGECLSLIKSFTDELSDSMKAISVVKTDDYRENNKPLPSEAAEKILLRQYNETYGIRRMMQDNSPAQSPEVKSVVSSFNEIFMEISRNWNEIKRAVLKSIPGLFYLFGEPDGAKTAYLLIRSQHICWIAEGLAGLCVLSLKEDKYGVVQNQLPIIVKSLLKLKMELDKLNNVNLNGKKIDRNFVALKNAITRSLFKICTVFSAYIRDFIDDPEDLKNLQCFLYYQEF